MTLYNNNENHLWGNWIISDNQKSRSCALCLTTESEELSAIPFEDVKDDKWYTDGILYCYHNGYMAGTSETIFGYKETVTRAEIPLIVMNYAESILKTK